MRNPLLAFVLLSFINANAQSVQPKLKFEQGQTIQVNLQLKTNIVQQAMGQAIDFNVEANADHSFLVTNTTEDNSTLKHSVDRVGFNFDGMGQKRKFDSKEEKDLNGNFGKPVKEILEKKYDMIIDNNGNTMMAIPDKIVLGNDDPRMAIITSMLKDIFDLVQPPKQGSGSFFKVLPDSGSTKGKAWTESYPLSNGLFNAAYTISDITDSTIVVDFASNSVTISKAEMMGGETTTNMNNKSTGRIILDRVTGIIREKTMKTDSNGNTETAFGTLPVTSTTNITMKVK
jgi:hypothetical protein